LNIYVDTSFIVSIYISDTHSSTADRLLASSSGVLCTPLHRVEFAHSVEQNIFRGQISSKAASQVYAEFERDCDSGVWREVGQPELTFVVAVDLARTHIAKLGTRTLDSLHVAAALELKAERFWTFDDRQKKLAKAVGLKTT